MGLFGKKQKIPEGIRVVYYEGELMEFPANYACQLLLLDDVLRITKINPYVEVKLDRKRILFMDILSERDYMQKYKSNSGRELKKGEIATSYYVINYLSKDGEQKHLDFWGTSADTLKMMKLRDQLANNQESLSYEI